MDEAAIRENLICLIEAITTSPLSGKAAGPHQGICHSEALSRQASVEGSLDYLRLQIKYLLFDLEATRRENRYLRQMLETRHRRDVDDLKGGETT